MNSAVNAFLLTSEQVYKAVNCRLSGQMWRTRYGIREMELKGEKEVVSAYRIGNTQGAIYYNPAQGQGALIFGDDLAQIAESSAGKMFTLQLDGNYALKVSDVSNGLQSPRHVHLAWICQAENYLFRSDDVGQTWAYNGSDPAQFSPGYIDVGEDRSKSKIPNRIGAMVYAFGRMHVVRYGRQILVGDALHSQNLTSSVNVTQFTEQTYWATGQSFTPPSQMGSILGGAILPQQDTTHGHSEMLWHAKNDGVFSLNTNIYPRSEWQNQALTRHALLSAAATGPYAIAISESDQYFRSNRGIQSIRSARAERGTIGTPYTDLASEVREFLKGDVQQDLRFCSLVRWQKQSRILCTCYPVVDGRYRWHRGFVVSNMLPGESRPDLPPAWEGLWTLPCDFGGVTQFVVGSFDGSERIFAICWNPNESRKRVVEIDETLHSDIIRGKPISRISSQIITKHLNVAGLFKTVALNDGFLHFSDIRTDINWQVDYRINGNTSWLKWNSGFIDNPDKKNLWNRNENAPDAPYSIGPAPSMQSARTVQFRIRWRGAASMQFMIRHSDSKEIEASYKPSPDIVEEAGRHNDYEYNDCGPRWEDINTDSSCR